MVWPGQAFEHEADHGEADEGDDRSRVALEIAGEATVSTDPGESAFDDPALGQNEESVRVGSRDDRELPRARRFDGGSRLRAPIARVGENGLDERKAPARLAKNQARPVAILNAGGVNRDAQQKAERVDEDMALAARDLLARVIALRVQRRAPF